MHAQLAENLRGIIVQTLLRKPGGGRVAARGASYTGNRELDRGGENVISLAIEAGRKVGMMSLVEHGGARHDRVVDPSEAYRRAGDRQGLLALLKRHGVDTTRIERFA